MNRHGNYSFRFVVDVAHHGLRIDTFLVDRLRNHAAMQLQRLAATGLVRINDTVCAPDQRVQRGECVEIELAEPPEPYYPPEDIALETIYDDPWLIAVNKPAGLMMHPAGPVGGGTVANALQKILDDQSRFPGLVRPGLVHRLDRETSGVVIVAKDYESHRSLTQQFERGAIRKVYVAIVSGFVTDNEGTIDLPIGQRPGSLLMEANSKSQLSRAASTTYRVLKRFRSTTLVELYPRTGRKHQIRVHLAAIGHPIVGDEYYSSSQTSGDAEHAVQTRDKAMNRHALHAAAIAFRHPITNAPFQVRAEIPADFWDLLGSVG